MSPRLSVSLAAILRRMRRMILPARVFGRPGALWLSSGAAMGLSYLLTQATNALSNASEGSSTATRVTLQ